MKVNITTAVTALLAAMLLSASCKKDEPAPKKEDSTPVVVDHDPTEEPDPIKEPDPAEDPTTGDASLSGIFFVSAEKKVHFTKGNLYFDGKTFHFEEHQSDVPTEWTESHAGYFFWSSSVDVATAGTYSESATAPTDIIFTNATADTPNPDFSVEGVAGKYRTLSASEWQYLFETRTDAASLYERGVTVCGKQNCIVIAPDGFEGKIEVSYDSAAWGKAVAAGLVCIPAAGYRDGSNVVNAGTSGYYWASTASYGGIVSNVTFDATFVTPSSYAMRLIGYPIRLVCD